MGIRCPTSGPVYGDYRGMVRGESLDVLTGGGAAVTVATVVTEIVQPADGAEVSISTADAVRRLDFDVVGDGTHSTTRDLVLADSAVEVVGTKWGGGSPPEETSRDLGEEVWGVGSFVNDVSGPRCRRRAPHRHGRRRTATRGADSPKAKERRPNSLPHTGVMNLHEFD